MNPCTQAQPSTGWKMTWVVLSNEGMIGTKRWLHTNLFILQVLLMFSDIACMHFNALFSGKTIIKYI